MRSPLNTPASLTEVGHIEVPLHDFLFVVPLFQLQRPEDFLQFSLDGDLIVSRDIFQHLLGNRRSAVCLAHGKKHVDQRTGSPEPVDPLMIVKVLVFNGNNGLFHIVRNLLIFYPVMRFKACQGDKLLISSGPVIVPDGACLIDGIIRKGYIDLRNEAVFHIIGKDACKKHTGKKDHNKC